MRSATVDVPYAPEQELSAALEPASCVVVVLTFNSVAIVKQVVERARSVSPQVFVVDSGSTDGTVELLRSLGCEVVNRAFRDYGDQRNWAIAQANTKAAWQLHLDADEVLDNEASAAIGRVLKDPASGSAYLLRRRDYFMGRMLRFSGLNPWHLRLFRSGMARCEDRLYDQHFIANVPAQRLAGFMHDRNAVTLTEWVARHNRWSDLESDELTKAGAGQGAVLRPKVLGDPRERVRWLKGLYYAMPSSARAVLYFVYRYVLRLGFLDGREGFYFAFFQALWFRMLVDAKQYERHKRWTKA
jgi:glycosyltransferase involved in cell wall biosynthesis